MKGSCSWGSSINLPCPGELNCNSREGEEHSREPFSVWQRSTPMENGDYKSPENTAPSVPPSWKSTCQGSAQTDLWRG